MRRFVPLVPAIFSRARGLNARYTTNRVAVDTRLTFPDDRQMFSDEQHVSGRGTRHPNLAENGRRSSMKRRHPVMSAWNSSIRRPRVSRSRFTRALAMVTLAAALGAAGCKSPAGPYSSSSGGGGGGGNSGQLLHLGPFAIGESETFAFANGGTFGYHCIPHRAMGMTGSVQVDANGADSVVVQIGAGGGLSFTPA